MKRSDKCSICLFVTGVVLTIFGFVLGYVIFPAVVDKLIREELDLWNDESEGRKNFNEPPVPVYMNFYLWDVLNPDNITDNIEKPRFAERGPYAYREVRKKVDVSNKSESECYIKAGQYKAYVFDESMSCKGCKADDKVTMINAPLVGLISTLRSKKQNLITKDLVKKLNNVANLGCSVPTNCALDFDEDHKDKLFIETTVNEYIFSGHKHGVMKWVTRDDKWAAFRDDMPTQITKENGFAVFNQKNDTAVNEYYEFDTAYCDADKSDYDNSDMKLYMDIRKWGKIQNETSTDLNSSEWWSIGGGYKGSNACNKIEGTDGQQFHPDVTADDKLWIFSTDLCRSMFLTYQQDVDVEGIPALQFAPPFQALQVNTTDNVGFCMEVEKWVNWTACIKETDNPEILDLHDCYNSTEYLGTCFDGTLNITKCMKAPVIMSSPHFYQNDDSLRTKFEGISPPDADKHETRLYIEPTTGMTIKLHKRIQINMPLISDPEVTLLTKVERIGLFPMIWVDESADIDEANVDKLKSMVVTPTRAVIGIQWVCVVAGIVMMLGVAVKVCVGKRK